MKKEVRQVTTRQLTQWGICLLIVSFAFLAALGWAIHERSGRHVAEKQMYERQATINKLVPAVMEFTAMPCAKVDMVDLGTDGFIIGGAHMLNMTAEDVKRHVSKSDMPGFPTAYVYVTGSNSTPKAEILALKPACEDTSHERR
ncbi:MAG: hypothetical protein Q7S49_00620 [bacterium]|nr:hypothetical protein [bacterium]